MIRWFVAFALHHHLNVKTGWDVSLLSQRVEESQDELSVSSFLKVWDILLFLWRKSWVSQCWYCAEVSQHISSAFSFSELSSYITQSCVDSSFILGLNLCSLVQLQLTAARRSFARPLKSLEQMRRMEKKKAPRPNSNLNRAGCVWAPEADQECSISCFQASGTQMWRSFVSAIRFVLFLQ